MEQAESNPDSPRVFTRKKRFVKLGMAARGIASRFRAEIKCRQTIYIVMVAGANVLPQWLRFKHWKWWMRTELVLWSIVLLSGVGT
jgi:hypothetical protein